MQETIAKESPRRRIARRIGAAGMALAAVLTLGACKATGGGQIDDPVPSGVLPTGDIDGAYTGDANFGFNFTCEVTAKNKDRDQGRDHLPRHRDQQRRGASTSQRLGFTALWIPCSSRPDCEAAAEIFLDAAQFEGTYRSQDTSLLVGAARPIHRPGVRPG